jgi:hypothetical protein
MRLEQNEANTFYIRWLQSLSSNPEMHGLIDIPPQLHASQLLLSVVDRVYPPRLLQAAYPIAVRRRGEERVFLCDSEQNRVSKEESI